MKPTNKLFNLLLWLGIIASTFTLIVYAYFGFFTRYMADDYCLLVSLSNADNVFSASWEKYINSSNRFSNLFIIGFWELFPHNIAFVPAVHIVFWLIGFTWLFYEINQLLNLKLNKLVIFLIAELLILFTLYTAPNVFQVLYWRPGQVTYLTPIVLFSLVTAWGIRLINQQTKSFNLYALLFAFLAFFIGGLSETLNALHSAFLGIILVVVYFFNRNTSRKHLLIFLSVLLAGTFLALLAMFFAPANALRINPENSTPSVLEVFLRSLDYTYAFLLGAFNSLPTPYIILVSIFGLLAYLFFLENKPQSIPSGFAWIFLLIPLITYALIFTSFAPSAYGQSYPVERVRFPAHLVLNIALVVLSVSIGYLLSQLKLPNFVNHLALASTILVLLYPFWMAQVPLKDFEYRRVWSKRWDERELMIYTAIHNGETDIVVPGLDGYEGTKELDALPTYWANQCAANYYGINSISTFSIKGNILEFFSE